MSHFVVEIVTELPCELSIYM